MIKFYTDQDLLEDISNEGYTYPLLTFMKDKSVLLIDFFLEVESIQESDIIILPVAIEYLYKLNKKNDVSRLFEQAKVFNKPMFTFTSGDIGLTIQGKNIYNLRLGGFHSKMDETTFIMPPFIEDPYIFLEKKVFYLAKQNLPTIGFVGHSNGGFVKLTKEFLLYLKTSFNILRSKEYLDYQSFYPSSFFRYKYLLKLKSRKQDLKTDFIFRKNYRAGAKTKKERNNTTLEFYNNISQNAYTFCVRGVGNWSVRFYETLAMGRVPVLIDTDCRLPFSNEINWENHCVIIKENEFDTVFEKLKRFHMLLSDDEFITLQQSNRKLWNDYFTKTGFFINLGKTIKTLTKN